MEKTWDSVSDVAPLFDAEEDVYAEHCDQVKNTLRLVGTPMRGFYQLLDASSRLPMAVAPHRFSLLIGLRQMEELVDELMILITLFRRICRTTSRDMIERRQEIKRKLDELVQGTEDILDQIQSVASASTCPGKS